MLSADPQPEDDATAAVPDREALLACLHGRIEPVPITMTYRLGLIGVVILMILLPLVYLLLTLGVAGLTLYHAVAHADWVDADRDGDEIALLISVVYLGLLTLGAFTVSFLVKPFFRRRPPEMEPEYLTRDDEPLLYAWVDRICDVTGTPRPTAICVDVPMSASAGFRRGFRSLGNGEMVLHLGLSLAANVDLRSFTGICAHEFGHFAQGTGMRLTYVIRTFNHWYIQLLYGDDRVNRWIRANTNDDGVKSLTASLFSLFTGLGIGAVVLKKLLIVGHGTSCFMLRQMEFDADRYEARICGNDSFRRTAETLSNLNAAYNQAMQELQYLWADHAKVDNIPAYISGVYGNLTDEARASIREAQLASVTEKYDTHPCDIDRIQAAKSESSLGLQIPELPATVLFSDFEGLCHRLSVRWYEAAPAEADTDYLLIPVGDLLGQTSQQNAAYERLSCYLQNITDYERPLVLSAERIAAWADYDPWNAKAELEVAHRAVVEAAPAAATLLLAGGGKQAKYRELSRNKPYVEPPEIAHFRKLVDHRLHLALGLLYDPQTLALLVDGAALRAETDRFVPVLLELATHLKLAQRISDQNRKIHDLLGRTYSQADLREARADLNGRTTMLRTTLLASRSEIEAVADPFSHSGQSLAKRLLPAPIEASDVSAAINASATWLTGFHLVYYRALGRLILAAEAVEAAYEIEPMPKAPELEPAEK